VLTIDCPYSWSDVPGQEKDTKFARRSGYKAKSCVNATHTVVINRLLTPSLEEVAHAERIAVAFRVGQARDKGRVEVLGSQAEGPST